jgi:outer membrane protein
MMRLVSFFAVPLAVGTLAAQVPTDTAARPIPLEEAVRLAQRNAPQAVQARGRLRESGAAVRSAYAAFIPSIGTSLNRTRQGGDRIGPQGNLIAFTGQRWSYSSGISASVDLFDGGRRLFDLQRARSSLDAADANEILQRYAVALDVKQEYFNVLAARESEAAARAQLEQAEQQLRAASARVAAGAATKSDSLRSVIQVGNARLALLTAENALRVANAALTRLVATPYMVTAMDIADSLDAATVALDSAALAQLSETGPAVDAARASERAAAAAVRSARSDYLPSVSASYSRGGSGFDNRFGLGEPTYPCPTSDNPTQVCPSFAYSDALRISLNLPIFNQYAREEAVARARVAEDNAEATLRDARLQAQQSLIQHLGALRTAEARIAIQLASVAAATEDLRVQQQRYALGASTLLDVLTSQTQLNQAQADLIQARYDYRVARAQIEALIGRDL